MSFFFISMKASILRGSQQENIEEIVKISLSTASQG